MLCKPNWKQKMSQDSPRQILSKSAITLKCPYPIMTISKIPSMVLLTALTASLFCSGVWRSPETISIIVPPNLGCNVNNKLILSWNNKIIYVKVKMQTYNQYTWSRCNQQSDSTNNQPSCLWFRLLNWSILNKQLDYITNTNNSSALNKKNPQNNTHLPEQELSDNSHSQPV